MKKAKIPRWIEAVVWTLFGPNSRAKVRYEIQAEIEARRK